MTALPRIGDRVTNAYQVRESKLRPLPEMADGWPVDRTICPRCLGRGDDGKLCHVCKGRPVCPRCRNGRVMSRDGVSLFYVVCPDCCDPTPHRTDTGVPIWTLNSQREAATIARYRAQQLRNQQRELVTIGADDDDLPFD